MPSVLYNIIISPIELVVEVVFELMFRIVGRRQTNQGLALIGVSLAISLMTLPLYRRADAVQQTERDLQKKLSQWASHIRRTFKGDERFMMLQTYYRENGYSPLQALNGSISLLLEIPFFIAAYHFLSHLAVLNGASFGPIADLGKPDALIRWGNVTLNLLPILMTFINCISSAVYLKGFPLKDKIQTYGMALIFLVLLYNSPSGLVVYWTCNNIFSLVKNLFYKLKNPRKVFNILSAVLGTLVTAIVFASGVLNSKKKSIVMIVFMLCTYLPIALTVLKKNKHEAGDDEGNENHSVMLFILPAMMLTILVGLLIPSAVIASSPAEFVDLQNYKNPLLYLINSTCYATGFFILWTGIIRHMLPQRRRSVLDLILWIASGISLVNYMCFGSHLGMMTSILTFEEGVSFSKLEKLVNLAVVMGLGSALYFLFRLKKLVCTTSLVLSMCTGIVAVSHINRTTRLLNDMAYIKDMKSYEHEPVFTLSRNGKNVIVFMLDRAISGYVPYIFNERPELKKQFAGFTYYPNTLSHGGSTNFGTPGLFGGYEYTPVVINKRSNELLVDKQNEALKVLPALFSKNGFKITVCEPPYAGYNWIPDLSIFDDIPNVNAFIWDSLRKNDYVVFAESDRIKIYKRNFFMYSIFKTMPVFFARNFYDDGEYFEVKIKTSFSGILDRTSFNSAFSFLQQINSITKVSDDSQNNYLAIQSSATHDISESEADDFEVYYDFARQLEGGSEFSADSDAYNGLDFGNDIGVLHYLVNRACLEVLGKWFDFMRENGVWDNTRIILVADHGRGLAQFDYMLMDNPKIDVEFCNPLLMVKDFGAIEFTVSDEFMTNADVPTLAVKDVIENPINPFTGKVINNDEKYAHPQIVTSSSHWDITKYNGTTFDTSDGHWCSVHDDIFNEENWNQLD